MKTYFADAFRIMRERIAAAPVDEGLKQEARDDLERLDHATQKAEITAIGFDKEFYAFLKGDA